MRSTSTSTSFSDDRDRPHHRCGGRSGCAAQSSRSADAGSAGGEDAMTTAAPVLAVRHAQKRFGAVHAPGYSRHIAARCWPCWETTVPASRRWLSASAASTPSTKARSSSTARLYRSRRRPLRAAPDRTVYQDLALFDNLTPAQNFFCGRACRPHLAAAGSAIPQRTRDGARDRCGSGTTQDQAAEI